MKRLVAALFVAVPLHAQQPGVTLLPDSVVARIDRAFSSLGGASAPGCGIGLSQDGKTVLTRAYGLSNLEYGVPNTPETVWESGSVAKQFTAASVLLLEQDGKLSLDDDIRKYLPEVPDFGKRITIRNLLTHTSGLRDQWGLLGLKGMGPGSQVHSLATIVDLVAHQKALNFDPGAEYLYSNTGFALAAVIVKRVSGRSLAEFSTERLFKPLGMTDTQWRDDYQRVVKGRATAYDRDARGFVTDMPFTNVYGNGGLLFTLADALKWNAFLDDPSAIPGGAKLVKALETPMIFNNGKASTYALGLGVATRDGIREVTHSGSTAGYRTWLARYPDRKVSVAVFCNTGSANPTGFGNIATNMLLGRVPRPPQPGAEAVTLSAGELEKYAGIFRSPSTQLVVRTAVKDGSLVTTSPTSLALVSTGADRFRVPGQGEIVYHFANGKPVSVIMVNNDTTRFDIMSVATPTAMQLKAYVGSYWSDELEARVTVEVRDSALVVKQRPDVEIAMRPTFLDGFVGTDVGNFVFTRNARGAVTGFGLWAGRVRNVRFTRER
ncbi:MAG: serine hydrolase domain-containing protein [Gemmatimonadaceae bacterium]